ncbi:MAG: phosphoribosylglycinamide formyltransferase [Candidatus Calescibacterium sp.]|jgi:phosphoribosylglycinamide formyltransferase-1
MDKKRKKIVVFASGSGTNFEEIAKKAKSNYIEADISLLISDKASAGAIRRAINLGVVPIVINWKNREEAEEKTKKILQIVEPDLIVLAGFMRILSPQFVSEWKYKILNIHPSLLPAFQGTTKAIDQAYNYGVKITGCTVHFVDESVDGGPIIIQAAVNIDDNDTPERIAEKIHKLEHEIYPWAIKKVIEGKIKIEGRKVKIIDDETINDTETIKKEGRENFLQEYLLISPKIKI